MRAYVVLVTGWRYWPWPMRHHICADLRAVQARLPVGQLLVVRHGACGRGADMIADQYAKREPGCEPEPHPAEWEVHDHLCGTDNLRVAAGRTGHRWCPGPPEKVCSRAGDRRNHDMVWAPPLADWALAYPGPAGQKSGTRNAIRHLRNAGIPGQVREFDNPDRAVPLHPSPQHPRGALPLPQPVKESTTP